MTSTERRRQIREVIDGAAQEYLDSVLEDRYPMEIMVSRLHPEVRANWHRRSDHLVERIEAVYAETEGAASHNPRRES